MWTQDFLNLLYKYTWKTYKKYISYNMGSIGLQAEGAVVKYRNWEIMELPE